MRMDMLIMYQKCRLHDCLMGRDKLGNVVGYYGVG